MAKIWSEEVENEESYRDFLNENGIVAVGVECSRWGDYLDVYLTVTDCTGRVSLELGAELGDRREYEQRLEKFEKLQMALDLAKNYLVTNWKPEKPERTGAPLGPC
jgi:hypothetical protein